MTTAPCKDCTFRHPGCHSVCGRYAEYSNERAEMNKHKMAEHEYAECHKRQAINALWRKRKKEKRR